MIIRRTVILVSAFSLLLCIATVVFQVRGNLTIGESLGIWHQGIQNIGEPMPPAWSLFPWLPITIGSGLLPLLAAAVIGDSIIKARRVRPGICSICGYNLAGNTSGNCPECGKTAPTATASPPAQ